MDTSDMRAFVRVVERESFSGAAAEFGLSPSAVSKLIAKLEERLGVRLLTRTTRRLTLTPEGELYLGRVRRILEDIDEAEAEVARARGAPRGKLRVNCGTAFGLHQLTPSLADFLARYPEIDLEISVTDRMVDLVEGHADIAVRSGHISDDSPYIVRKISDLERVVCAAPSYLAARGIPSSPADLKSHDCIVVASPGLNRWPFRAGGVVAIEEIKPRVSVDDAEAGLRLAIEGAGIIRMSDVIVGEPIRKGELVPLLTDVHHAEPLALSAMYQAGRYRLPKVRVFVDFLYERFGHAPWRWQKPA